jgi:hypothetical protein
VKVLFLDIDGVLNRIDDSPVLIEQDCVRELNRILDKTGASYVVTSSWRYMIHNGHFDLHGFQYLLTSHGVRGRMLGYTGSLDDAPRWKEISRWLADYKGRGGGSPEFCILDDDAEARGPYRERYVGVTCDKGLTRQTADRCIKILGEKDE